MGAQLQQAMGAHGMTTDNFAVLARRALLGRCVSCDADINVDLGNVKRPPPVSRPTPYPNNPPPGAAITMRPPAAPPPGQMPAVILPRISDNRASKEFPKGRIFKNPSAPDIRQSRSGEQSPS